jgi:hypothetical protein
LAYDVFVRSPGEYKLDKATTGTDFVILAVRILVDANNANDIRVNEQSFGRQYRYLKTHFLAQRVDKESYTGSQRAARYGED